MAYPVQHHSASQRNPMLVQGRRRFLVAWKISASTTADGVYFWCAFWMTRHRSSFLLLRRAVRSTVIMLVTALGPHFQRKRAKSGANVPCEKKMRKTPRPHRKRPPLIIFWGKRPGSELEAIWVWEMELFPKQAKGCFAYQLKES